VVGYAVENESAFPEEEMVNDLRGSYGPKHMT
jgi:hypothetical protein